MKFCILLRGLLEKVTWGGDFFVARWRRGASGARSCALMRTWCRCSSVSHAFGRKILRPYERETNRRLVFGDRPHAIYRVTKRTWRRCRDAIYRVCGIYADAPRCHVCYLCSIRICRMGNIPRCMALRGG